ncbi:hypothetical protein BDD12DRAFT_839186 [Trichophaea hybrida]|nr:hypothetical protein BDD12DRAFT_839186 [Trichophaea hybrida]
MSAAPITFSSPSTPPDVEIRILDKVYHLHSDILRFSCSFFDKSLSDTWRKNKDAITTPDGLKYRFTLVFKEGESDSFLESGDEVNRDMTAAFDKICMTILEFGGTDDDEIWFGEEDPKCYLDDSVNDEITAKLLSWKSRLLGAYGNLFRIFYHRSCSQTIITIDDVRRTLELADKYCCLSTVSAVLTERVLFVPRNLPKLLSGQPVLMLNMAIKLRSKKIFNDAFIHLELPEAVRELAEKEYIRICELQLECMHEALTKHCSSRDMNSMLYSIRLCMVDQKDQPSKMFQTLSRVTVDCVSASFAALIENNLLLAGGAEFDHLTCASLEENEYPWEEGDCW